MLAFHALLCDIIQILKDVWIDRACCIRRKYHQAALDNLTIALHCDCHTISMGLSLSCLDDALIVLLNSIRKFHRAPEYPLSR